MAAKKAASPVTVQRGVSSMVQRKLEEENQGIRRGEDFRSRISGMMRPPASRPAMPKMPKMPKMTEEQHDRMIREKAKESYRRTNPASAARVDMYGKEARMIYQPAPKKKPKK